MYAEPKQFYNKRKFGVKSLAVMAGFFLLVGGITASGLDLTSRSQAEAVIEGRGGQDMSQPISIPLSFTALAEKLSPTVVNVKVTKVAKATFHGPKIPDHGNIRYIQACQHHAGCCYGARNRHVFVSFVKGLMFSLIRKIIIVMKEQNTEPHG